jgi:hypothetical protein
MSEEELARQREAIRQALTAGLQTQWRDRAYESADVQRTIAELQAVPPDRLEDKLRVAGFTRSPYVDNRAPDLEQACRTCMYYELHHRYCNLPELKLGVEPDWCCVLWRV